MEKRILDNFKKIPVIPLIDIVAFPGTVFSIFVGRDESVKTVNYLDTIEDKSLFLVTQNTKENDYPTKNDIYKIGVEATVLQSLALPDGTIKLLLECKQKGVIYSFYTENEITFAEIKNIENFNTIDDEIELLNNVIDDKFIEYTKVSSKIPPEILDAIKSSEYIFDKIGLILSNIEVDISLKQELLELDDIKELYERIILIINNKIQYYSLKKKIVERVNEQSSKVQKEYILNEQLKAIQKEISASSGNEIDDLESLKKQIENLNANKDVKDKAFSELSKLKIMNHSSAEAGIIRNYLDWIVNLPWNKSKKISININKVKSVLDKNHYGLDKVKERLLEYLAVQKRKKKNHGVVICLLGPPGVGKTSLAKSLAEVTGRKFSRVSLGGVHDESEIRGHRRTYVGAMPGRIIQSLKKAKSNNPLILLDEIDKITKSMHGDPSSALLEVLDKEQNNSFYDHFVDIECDLSKVMFVATANSLSGISKPLLDRMEVIHISGYTEQEKLEIAEKHLINKKLNDNGVKKEECIIEREVLLSLIQNYTRESGVRGLQRELDKIIRKVLTEITEKNIDHITVNKDNMNKYLGVQKFNFGVIEKNPQIGIVNGLAYTEVGGDILTIEAVISDGEGKCTYTGQLGDVMKESVQTAFRAIKSRFKEYNIDNEKFKTQDIHIHVPEGATPKDGPSAGIAMYTCIMSLLLNKPISNKIAMTGEVTLRGKVLPIGGLKEKLLAALRGGVTKVLIPIDNKKDFDEIPEIVKKGLEIVTVSNVDEVIKHSLID